MHFFTILGLMSGTSMDGINGSIVKTNGSETIRMNINEKIFYSEKTKRLLSDQSIKKNYKTNQISPDLILNITENHGNLVKKIIQIHKLIPDYIGFHGQTLYHDPYQKNSLQIGDPNLLAQITNIKVISDFRQKDLSFGGQGAPLAPIYHQKLMDSLKLPKPSCFVNIGGVSNITYWDGVELIGFDTGPGNHFLDKYCQEVLDLPYDESGRLASAGKEKREISNKFLKDPYFKKFYPKSLDKSHFDNIYNKIEANQFSHEDFLSSLSSVTANSIIKSLDLLPKKIKLLVVMGGGSYNDFLIQNIKKLFKGETKTADEIGLLGDFIESELICLLTARFLNDMPTTFPSTTGVLRPTVGGKLYKS